MSFLTIAQRELKLAARRPFTYYSRAGMALVAILVELLMLASSNARPAEIGKGMFIVLSLLGMFYALLSGVRCTADTISEEKREGTLGLLFLTPLRGPDIVVGKLVVTSLDAAYGIVAGLPLLALPVLFGAVTGSEFWRMSLLLLNTLFFSLAVGILVSTFGRSGRGVMIRTLATLLFVTFGLPVLWSVLTRFANQRWVDALFLFPSPAYTFRAVTSSSFRLPVHEYGLSMGTIFAGSVAALGVSGLVLHRMVQTAHSSASPSPLLEFLYRWRFATPRWQSLEGRDLIGPRPFLWLLRRDRLPAFWLSLAVLGTLTFTLWLPNAFLPQRNPVTPMAMFSTFGLHLLFKVLVAGEAVRHLSEDKRSGALELLLSTPLQTETILTDQWRSLRRLYAAPFLGLLLLNVTLILSMPSSSPGEERLVIFGGALMALFDFYALSWLGMLRALRGTRYTPAVLRTLAGVLVWPWVVVLVFMSSSSPSSRTMLNFFFWWFLSAAVYDLVLARWARERLLRHFRRYAANDLPETEWEPVSSQPVT